MKQQLKMKSLKSVLLLSLLLLVLGIAMLSVTKLAALKLLTPPKVLDDLTPEEMVGQYVTYDVTLLYDTYAYTTETTKGTTRSKVISCEYVIPVGWEDGYFMGLVANKKDLDTLDTLLEESFDYLDGGDPTVTQLTVTGTVLEMDNESRAFFHEAVGYDEDPNDTAYQEMFLPYYLKIDYVGENILSVTLLMTAVGLGMTLCGGYMLIRALTGGYQRSIAAYCKQTPDPIHTMEQIEQWYESTEEINGLRTGSRWFMVQQGAHTHLLETSKIVWAYLRRVEHRTNGIKTGTNYSLVLRTTDHKKYEAGMRKEEQVRETLEHLERSYPGILLGYDKELEKLYDKDMHAFQQLAASRPEVTQ